MLVVCAGYCVCPFCLPRDKTTGTEKQKKIITQNIAIYYKSTNQTKAAGQSYYLLVILKISNANFVEQEYLMQYVGMWLQMILT